MKKIFLASLLVLTSISLLPAQSPPLLVGFGSSTESITNTTNDPFHAFSGFPSYTTWNLVHRFDVTSGLKYGDGTSATGVSINLGVGAGTTVNFSGDPTTYATGTGVFTQSPYTSVFTPGSPATGGVYYTPYGGSNTSTTTIGASIGGLAAGSYQIYVVGVNTDNPANPQNPGGVEAENFYCSASATAPTTADTSTMGLATTETLNLMSTGTWVSGNQCAYLTVTLTASQYLNLYGTGAGSGAGGESRGFFNSIEIVPLPLGNLDAADMPSYGAWTSSIIGGGGWMQNVVFTRNPAVLYTYEDVGGFYRSDDGGQHWYMLTGNLPNLAGSSQVRCVVADPNNENHILVACGVNTTAAPTQGIYESFDGGMTFNLTLTARFAGNAAYRQDGFVIVRDPNNPGNLLAASEDQGIFRSTNGAMTGTVTNPTTWTLCGSNTVGYNFTDVKFDRNNSLLAYACAQPSSPTDPPGLGGYFVSNDGGQTWAMTGTTSPCEMAQDPVRSSPSRFYGTFHGYSSSTGTVEYTDNGGASWTMTTGLSGTANYRGITANPGTGSMVISDTTGNFYKLISGQTAWTSIPLASVNYRGWTWAAGSPPPRNMWQNNNESSISIDPNNASHWFDTGAFGIFETMDAGADWWTALDGVESTVIETLFQDPSNSSRVHLGMEDNAYLNSMDGGTSFQSTWIPTIYNVKDIELSPSLPSRVYMVCGNGRTANELYYSTDSGASWTKSPMTGLPANALFPTIAVSPTNADECFVGVAGADPGAPGAGVYHSTDGGQTWQWFGTGMSTTATFFFDYNYGYIRRQIATGPPATEGGPCSVACVRPYANSVYTLDRDTNTWVQATSTNCPPNPQAIVGDPNVAGSWIISDVNSTGTGGIYKLLNGVFTKQFAGTDVNYLAADLVTPGRFAASGIDGVLLSTDSGVTWNYLDQNLPMKQGYNALAFAGNRLVAGSSGSGVYWITLP